MLDVEVIGDGGPDAPPAAEVERLVGLALAAAGVAAGIRGIRSSPAKRSPTRIRVTVMGQELAELMLLLTTTLSLAARSR